MVKSKFDMFKRLAEGEFGNTSRIYFDVESIPDGMLVMTRRLTPSDENLIVTKKNYYYLNCRNHYHVLIDKDGRIRNPKAVIYQECITPDIYDFNFEICRVPGMVPTPGTENLGGFCLRYSYGKNYAKENSWINVQGLTAKIRFNCLLGADAEWIIDLMDTHDAVVEGVKCTQPVGVLNQNVIIWECRGY